MRAKTVENETLLETNIVAVHIAKDNETGSEERNSEIAEKASRIPIPDSEEKELTEAKKRRVRLKIAGGLILASVVAFVIIDSSSSQYIFHAIQQLIMWIKKNRVAGVFAFIGVYFLGTVILLPGSILTFAGGFVFSCTFGLWRGLIYGTICVFIGASAGAVWAFLLGRYLLRKQMEKLCNRFLRFKCFDRALKKKGFHIMLLLRLSPVVPFNVMNYMMGVTSVSFFSYCLAMVGIIPAITLLLFIGATAGSITESKMVTGEITTGQIVSYAVGGAFGLTAMIATTYYARKELIKETCTSASIYEERHVHDGHTGSEISGAIQLNRSSSNDQIED